MEIHRGIFEGRLFMRGRLFEGVGAGGGGGYLRGRLFEGRGRLFEGAFI